MTLLKILILLVICLVVIFYVGRKELINYLENNNQRNNIRKSMSDKKD